MSSSHRKYDHLSLETAIDRAWDDTDLSAAQRKALRVRVRAINPALARVLDRYVATRRADPDWATNDLYGGNR